MGVPVFLSRVRIVSAGLVSVVVLGLIGQGAAAAGAPDAPTPDAPATPTLAADAASTDPVGSLTLLTDPYLQAPTTDGVTVAWASAFAGSAHVALVGAGVAELAPEQAVAAASGSAPPPADVRVVAATSTAFSRLADDVEGARVEREAWRHEAQVTGLTPGQRTDYRVVSVDGEGWVVSGTFTLAPAARPGEDLTILLTSDHQAMANTAANLEQAAATLGEIDAVLVAGDLVNQPDAGSQWFESPTSFFSVMQGNAARESNGRLYRGGEIAQHAPIFPAVGNHEVQGRLVGPSTASISSSYNAPTPRSVAEAAYERDAATINPGGDPAVRELWIENHSWSTTSYEEMFTLPVNDRGDETYYATTIGDVRVVSLFSTRIWRGTTAQPDPATRREGTSRFQEAPSVIDDEFARSHGSFIFEELGVGSDQYAWLQDELASPEFQKAPFRVVMLHEGPQGLGDNIDPPFADPVEIRETNEAGELVGIRYEYPRADNDLLHEVQPLLESAGTDLVLNGHSHLWNRFEAESGTQFLETSNTGNTYGAYHPLSGRSRALPPAPWDATQYTAQGNPGGLEPIVPNVAPFTTPDGVPQPFISSNDLAVFSVLRTGPGTISTYSYDVRTPDVKPVLVDEFSLGRPAAPVFTDVPADSEFAGDIAWLAQKGITNGWTNDDGTREFRPLEPLARDAMAAFLYRLAGKPSFTAPATSSFSDVQPGDQFYKEITWLAAEGITTGWDDGDGSFSFRPLEPIGRDAMAAFLYRYEGITNDAPPNVSAFDDVAPEDLYYREISWLAENEVTLGWQGNDGTVLYRPTAPIARDAIAAFLHRFDAL
jgi:Calcineurin-like phosphoesterase/S-layer homology domain